MHGFKPLGSLNSKLAGLRDSNWSLLSLLVFAPLFSLSSSLPALKWFHCKISNGDFPGGPVVKT